MSLASCIDLYATGAKGGDALKNVLPLLAVRAMRALATQLKWQSFRYGPMDGALWGVLYKIYAVCEARKFSKIKTQVYPAVPGESSPELEFLKAAMFNASSPDSLLPLETELMERLVAHHAPYFVLLAQPSGAAYWADLGGSVAPLRLIKAPPPSPTLRYFSAGGAIAELEKRGRPLHQPVRCHRASIWAVPTMPRWCSTRSITLRCTGRSRRPNARRRATRSSRASPSPTALTA